MNDLNYLKDNIMSRRWKTKYEQCSQAVRDKLDEMYINEYQYKLLKEKEYILILETFLKYVLVKILNAMELLLITM